MGALPSHNTSVTDGDWDGPAAVASCKAEKGALRYIHGWVDSGKDANAKGSYKFPHHRKNGGPAVIAGCNAVIGALNGARGGSSIPAADRRGVWRHVAAHLRKSGKEPAPLRCEEGEREYRAALECRVAQGSRGPVLEGHAAVFNTITRISSFFFSFDERFLPGAFADAIKPEGDDIRALFNHNPDCVLGRNRPGTLFLEEDEKGLFYRIEPPKTSWANDLLALVERGDISGGSIAFYVPKGGDEWTGDEAHTLRSISRCGLYDISIATYPAYHTTDVAVRMLSGLRSGNLTQEEMNSLIEAKNIIDEILVPQREHQLEEMRKQLSDRIGE